MEPMESSQRFSLCHVIVAMIAMFALQMHLFLGEVEALPYGDFKVLHAGKKSA